ncbi:MAG: DUF2203 domain-containing protein [Bryobacteraceae bacterium]
MPRRFTLAEAESLLPTLRPLLSEAAGVKSEYDRAARCFDGLLQRIMLMGGLAPDREEAAESRHARDRAGERLKRIVEKIEQNGCVLKDLDIGLVDFPTVFRGEEVYLCWKMDEPRIAWWHGVEEGFAGRKPIDREFREKHQGDKPH